MRVSSGMRHIRDGGRIVDLSLDAGVGRRFQERLELPATGELSARGGEARLVNERSFVIEELVERSKGDA